MAKKNFIKSTLAAFFFGFISLGAAWAGNTDIASVRLAIDQFRQSSDSPYAPKTISRSEAYLGAAMLAHNEQKSEDETSALTQAGATLEEARQTAAAFHKQFADILLLKQQASTIRKIISATGQSDQGAPTGTTMKDAENAMASAITTHEQGDLNRMREYADSARAQYKKLLETSLPLLADMADSAIAKAANAGGKQYAPATYSTAKERVAALRAYVDGIGAHLPEHPEHALYLAREARHMSLKVKALRKKTASHEKLILEQRGLKLKLADMLELNPDTTDPMMTDISDKTILSATAKIHQALADERKARLAERLQLKKQYETDLAARLNEQTEALTETQKNQMSSIKEAFNAKLERETFEQKRQQRVHAIFQKGEAAVLANLDGSLLIRLSGLKFASGQSRINTRYYDMLGHLKETLSIYSDRGIRIEGHTDNQGDVKANQRLSLKRAESVRDFLITAGADGSRMRALGYGEVRPIASNEFDRGREMNRRIDIVIEAAPAK